MTKPKHVIVIGAGLVGALLATMLSKRGVRVTIFEKRPDMRKVKVAAGKSINLALAERGIHGLRMAGLFDEVEPLLIPMRGRMLHELDGTTDFSPYGQRPGEVIYSVSRGQLNQIMLDAVELVSDSTLVFNHDVRSVDFDARTVTMVNTVNNIEQTVDFEFLIGADGSGSAVRQCMIQEVGGEDRTEFLDHDYKELNIPAGTNGAFQLEREALHIWPRGGFMLIALPNLDGSFTVTLFLPRQGENSFAKLQNPADVHSFFKINFPDALALIPDLVDDFFSNPTGQMGTVRCWPWIFRDAAMLIGDAAHGIVPFHGQGMNCGFEDCSQWCKLLDQHHDDWVAAMQEFQTIRKPNTDAIATMALENYIVMRDSVRDPKYQLKKEIGFELERMFPRQFIPRYSMVMFHRIPYRVVLDRGLVQEKILDELVRGIDHVKDFDKTRAAEAIAASLLPLS